MSAEDAIAIATLAGARCAQLGLTSIPDYFSHYVQFERLFMEHRAEQARIEAASKGADNVQAFARLKGEAS